MAHDAYEQFLAGLLKQRFEAKYKRGEIDECWPWLGSLDQIGYGMFKVGKVTNRAHRVAHEFYCGPIPIDKVVMHTCDNRRCVNPKHLTLGTQKENVDDMMRKGRKYKILSEEQILEIKSLLAEGHKQYTIADKFGIHQSVISRIKTGNRRRWHEV